jgi:CheY-like chemotaxis protein
VPAEHPPTRPFAFRVSRFGFRLSDFLPPAQFAACAARSEETILVVEDEELVNELTVHILGEAGYRVLSAKDGVEACETFAGAPGAIDLVLLDVIMPRMGGREAAERIREMRADTAVLFCSGYSGPALEMSMALPRNQPVLAKPYQPRDLLKRVREALDKRAAQAAN